MVSKTFHGHQPVNKTAATTTTQNPLEAKMLKRFSVALAALFVLGTSAFGAGTVPGFNLTPQFDKLARPIPGCKLYIIQAGTVSTPQNAYQDSGLTLLQTNPIICDSASRLPQWFVADGTIKLRLTDKNGTEIFAQDGLLVVGASSGGGGGSTLDPTTVIATGDIKARYGTGVLAGFVRANGRTIGSATSGASERANPDAQALFEYLWNADTTLVVSTGRGASSNADWVANKTLTLPDWRGRTLAALDDMGNSAAGRLTATYFGNESGCSGIILGCQGGRESRTLTLAHLPTGITSSQSNLTISVTSTDSLPASTSWITTSIGNTGANLAPASAASIGFGTRTSGGTVNIATTSNNTGSGGSAAAHPIVQPTMLATFYMKL